MIFRPRRLRKTENIRKLVRETSLSVDDFVYPIFIVEGKGKKEEIPSMPGIFRFSIDMVFKEIEEALSLGIKAIILFGIPDFKDDVGTSAYIDDGIIQRAVREIKKRFNELVVITDVCMCEYTSHGHCGIVRNGEILNDETTEILGKIAVSHSEAGADIVAPSAMMDGQVRAIRKQLDENGFYDIPIMAYSAKYASGFYGPFRDAAESAPSFGDRASYQMDIHNQLEAMREIELDVIEGADIIMVKPALAYLDIIKMASLRYELPIAAYNVSGEYSMIKAAGKLGWIDEKKVIYESLIAIKRAGAKIILTYFAKEVASWIKEGKLG